MTFSGFIFICDASALVRFGAEHIQDELKTFFLRNFIFEIGRCGFELALNTAVPSKELRAGLIRRWTMSVYTTASGRLDHATFRERADELVRCSGFEAMLRHADRPTRHGPDIANDL